ncbi:sensor histidine kinase [Streptomyces hiroshimensis]|uniref:Signal transduction histidine kinase subgroup 3 dimerisation and phosphoacceptor domain-containing protein n=1 Tax=Streptomyces hiroshimensis TaxID=66424 RepID=A0ABQ2YVF0_9ACTN|nr:histidine kinase [Streptomyces hiroshimensis]GGX96632.1 hypothetical protein GCM10010324_48280 [Streptomyces hiroshimensis]
MNATGQHGPSPDATAAPGDGRIESVLGRGRGLPAPRRARLILIVALLCYLSITVINLLSTSPSPVALAAGLTCLPAIFALQLWHSNPGAQRAPAHRKALTLGLQAVLTYLPLLAFHSRWGSMAGFLAGSLLLQLPARPGWLLYGLVGLSMLVPPLLDGETLLAIVYLAQSTLLTGLVVYGLARLTELVRVLHDTRHELSRVAVTKERLRFARDLHDLLGFSLSAITLKSELILRLIPHHPAGAVTEVGDVLAIARQSLADVRTVASGLRTMSLAQEVTSARAVLAAADVEVRGEVALDGVGARTETVLAAVLREAVTNLLRHTKATYCDISAVCTNGRVRLTVVNDGVDPEHRDPSPDSGSGLGNLATRLASVNGTLTAGSSTEGIFRLCAEAPA